MLQQPLVISLGEEEDDISLRLFYTIQLHAGNKLSHTLPLIYMRFIAVLLRYYTLQWKRIWWCSSWRCGYSCPSSHTKMSREGSHLQWVLFAVNKTDNRATRYLFIYYIFQIELYHCFILQIQIVESTYKTGDSFV